MQNHTIDEPAMVRYLFGELSEEEQLAFEEQYFSDTALYERLQNVEDELIYRYVENELSSRERGLFEKRILTRPRQREKVKLAQALKIYLTREQAHGKATTGSVYAKIIAWLQSFGSNPAFAYSLATAVVAMIFTGSWLFFETKNLQTRLSQFETEQLAFRQREQELKQQAETQREQTEALTEQLSSEQNRRAEIENKLSQSSPQYNVPTFSLIQGASRSSQEINQQNRLQISPETQLVRLQLYIGKPETYGSYRVVLENAVGDTILTQYQITAQRTEKGKAVILLLPAHLFSYDDYVMTLLGVLPSREIDEVGDYFFSVIR